MRYDAPRKARIAASKSPGPERRAFGVRFCRPSMSQALGPFLPLFILWVYICMYVNVSVKYLDSLFLEVCLEQGVISKK